MKTRFVGMGLLLLLTLLATGCHSCCHHPDPVTAGASPCCPGAPVAPPVVANRPYYP
jgi:hypothetical protein